MSTEKKDTKQAVIVKCFVAGKIDFLNFHKEQKNKTQITFTAQVGTPRPLKQVFHPDAKSCIEFIFKTSKDIKSKCSHYK